MKKCSEHVLFNNQFFLAPVDIEIDALNPDEPKLALHALHPYI